MAKSTYTNFKIKLMAFSSFIATKQKSENCDESINHAGAVRSKLCVYLQ